MRLGSREEEVRGLIREHLQLVRKCVSAALDALQAYAKAETDKARALCDDVDTIESDADKRRREIARKLFEGAFLPVMREPLLGFVKRADRVADAAERVCEVLVLTRVEIPEEFKIEIAEIASNATSSTDLVIRAFDAVFGDISNVLDLVHECTAIEHVVDCRFEDVVSRIFSSDLPLAHKTQLHDLIEKIDDIVDAAEDATDVLEMLTVITSV